jgi:hypothetical protein
LLLYSFCKKTLQIYKNQKLGETSPEAAAELPNKEERDGSGRATEILAQELGISATTIHHARSVAASAPPEVIDRVQQRYNKTKYRLTGRITLPGKGQQSQMMRNLKKYKSGILGYDTRE